MSRFTFPVKTEKEIEEARLLPEGDFLATVDEAKFKTTKNGAPMISLRLRAVLPDGSEKSIFSNIMLDDDWAWLHRHFWTSAGYLEKYEQGELMAADYLSKKVTIRVKNGFDKNTNKMRSSIIDFIVKEKPFPDEDISF